MSTDSRSRLLQLCTDLSEIEASRANWHKIEEWCTRTRPLIELHFPTQLGHFDKLTKNPFRHSILELQERARGLRQDNPSSPENDERAMNSKAKLLAMLVGTHQATEGNCETSRLTEKSQIQNEVVVMSTKVFIVHGHDDAMKQSVARTLEKLKLEPIILHEQPDSGKTIIEKLEGHAISGFAVILLSPDDMGYLKDEKAKDKGAKNAKPRARENVILELGYFVGSLGRDKVMALKRGNDLEVPSDLSGVVYTPFDDHGAWEMKLVRELKAAGYIVDANALTPS